MIGRNRPAGVVFRDFTLLMVMAFIAMVIFLIPWVNPPGEADDAARPPGAVTVWVFWQSGNIDLDTWLLAPGEQRPIGYSNKNGRNCNLLRDDLGNPDPERNFETVYCRGITPGRWWINLHVFRSAEPVHARVEVSVDDGTEGKASIRIVAQTELTLQRRGDERTAISFELSEDGRVVPGSMNNVFKGLRAMRSSSGSPFP